MKELDHVFDLLHVEQRRFVLYYLEKRDEPVPVSEVAATVREWKDGAVAPENLDDIDEKIAITLKHRDIPKMEKVEYIKYDSDENEIRLTGVPSEVDVLLSVTEAIEHPAEDDIIHL